MRSRPLRLASLALLAMTATSALAGCPDTKSTVVFNSRQGGSYLFYYLLGDRTVRFTVEGKSFRMDTGRIPGHALYEIDDKVLQMDRVDRKNFASFVRGDGEEQTLDAQARYEQHYVQSMAPEVVITDLGARTRTEAEGKNPRLFRIWKFQMPESQAQYSLTTLMDADTVLMISASLPGTEEEALGVLRSYAASLQAVSKTDCARIKWP